MERIILHSDLNNFYASVECMLNPNLKDKYVAVCGNREDRHGIVLAKNQKAKMCGVKTGETIWQAKQKCPDLVVVPPQFSQYLKYSHIVRKIYEKYTDLIEPFGMDECWLDVTGSVSLFGSGREIAEKIRRDVKKETGLTVSVGVSFNKIFAKLGSDLKKPDAVSEIPYSNFKSLIWNLPACDLFGVGRQTTKKLEKHAIYTIGDIANTDPKYLKKWFGKNGVRLWQYANGFDKSRVAPTGYTPEPKSIGHGITTTSDLVNDREVKNVICDLSQSIAFNLKEQHLLAKGISVCVRDNSLLTQEYQLGITEATHSARIISRNAFDLFRLRYNWQKPVRAVTVRAINLCDDNVAYQLSIFNDATSHDKLERLENAIDNIRSRYGNASITYASLKGDLKMPKHKDCEIIMPHYPTS